MPCITDDLLKRLVAVEQWLDYQNGEEPNRKDRTAAQRFEAISALGFDHDENTTWEQRMAEFEALYKPQMEEDEDYAPYLTQLAMLVDFEERLLGGRKCGIYTSRWSSVALARIAAGEVKVRR